MEPLERRFGGIIGVKFNSTSKKVLSFILSFASGLMMSIICFNLIPEAMEISGFDIVITGIGIGIIVMIISDIIVQNKLYTKKNSLLKTGIAVGIGLALHNFPEGLSIGSGFEASLKLRIFSCNNNCNTRHTRRNFNGSSNEKWRYEFSKSYNFCNFIRSYNWNWRILWKPCTVQFHKI